jgi:uncharacterized protein (DUF1015 family)
MAALVPFRALRPVPSAAPRVAAVPYDVVSGAEARALAIGEPLSFLHVSRAEIDLPSTTGSYADEVYARAAANLAVLTREAPLVREGAPSLYVYGLRMGTHVQTGVAGCFAVEEYERGLIRRHERTRREKEDDRTRHVVELRAQTGPVFLVHRASEPVRAVVVRVVRGAPLFEFEAADGVRHMLWRAGEEDGRALVDAFAGVPVLYIADGHHRAAAAARARQQLGGIERRAGEWDTFLAVAFPHDEVQVLPYNRIVRDLNGRTPESLLRALRERFEIGNGSPAPERRGDVAMFLDGRWQTIALGAPDPSSAPGEQLDVGRLQAQVLDPLLGIREVTTDPRLEFVGGVRGAEALEALVASGAAAVAFSMYPVGVDQVMAISDAGAIMPPKSTWFEPKLRDGLLVHVI